VNPRCAGPRYTQPMRVFPPRRIVCLTEETVETLYLLGEDARIVGVSGYAVRPPQVRREKPRVAAFITADVDKILALEPDLVLTFSDLQAAIVMELVKRGVTVHAFNQRDLAGIYAMIETLGALVGAPAKGARLAAELRERVASVTARMKDGPRPRVYFEEWDEPMISGIGWVSEVVEAAGGVEVFPELARKDAARDRIVTAEQVIEARPDVVIGSWCGKKFQPAHFATRPGFETLPAIRDGFLREVKSALILQPGPAALTDGLDAVVRIVEEWRASQA
jgi:iron complex transport system substrate-binding protein